MELAGDGGVATGVALDGVQRAERSGVATGVVR